MKYINYIYETYLTTHLSHHLMYLLFFTLFFHFFFFLMANTFPLVKNKNPYKRESKKFVYIK